MSKDRKDGKYVKPNNPIHAIIPYLMETRVEAEVYLKTDIDITKLAKWIEEKNEKLDFKMTYFQVLTACIAKMIYNRPLLNRFVQGHRVYEREDVSVSFVAKDKFSDDAKDMMVVMKVKRDENAIDLSRRMAIDIFKTKKDGTNDLNKTLDKLLLMPRWLLRIVAKIVKWLDYHGWLPKSFTDTDSNYATVLLSNLGSIKTGSCYHHLNNYGTNSIVITIGVIRKEKNKVIVDIGATVDERIAEGFYFAKSLKLVEYIAHHPEILEEELGSIIDCEF